MNRPTCCGGEYVPTPTGQRGFHRRTCWKYRPGTKVGEETAENERGPIPGSYEEAHSDDEDDVRDVRGETVG